METTRCVTVVVLLLNALHLSLRFLGILLLLHLAEPIAATIIYPFIAQVRRPRLLHVSCD